MLKIIRKALYMKRNLGTRCAAGYMRNQGVSLNTTRLVLATNVFGWAVRP